MADRRNFLKLFGIGAAAIPIASVAGTQVEERTIPRSEVDPIRPDWSERQYADIQSAQLYSAMNMTTYDGSWSDRNFFRYSIGEHIPGIGQATIADTNMCMAGRLPQPEAFLVQRMGLVFSPTAAANERSRFIENTTLELWLGQKLYQRFPLSSVFSVGDRRKASQLNPDFPLHSTSEIQLPVVLHPEMSFYVRADGKYSPESPLRCWAILGGLHARGVC